MKIPFLALKTAGTGAASVLCDLEAFPSCHHQPARRSTRVPEVLSCARVVAVVVVVVLVMVDPRTILSPFGVVPKYRKER